MNIDTETLVEFSSLSFARKFLVSRARKTARNLRKNQSGGMAIVSNKVRVVVNLEDGDSAICKKKQNSRIFKSTEAAIKWIEGVLIRSISNGELNTALARYVSPPLNRHSSTFKLAAPTMLRRPVVNTGRRSGKTPGRTTRAARANSMSVATKSTSRKVGRLLAPGSNSARRVTQ